MAGKTAVRLITLIWAAAFILLPLTSFPLVSELVGGSLVAPLSILLIGVLVVVWFVPYLWKGGKLPIQSLPLIAFAVIAVLSCLVSYFRIIPIFRDHNFSFNMIEGLLTLFIGIASYLLVAVWAGDSKNLGVALRWIHWGGVAVVLWSAVQAIYFHFIGAYPNWMWSLQDFFTSNGILFNNRVTGLAYEPSWLAHQLNMLYLPLWVSATINRFSIFKFRVLKLSLENFLLAGGLATLFLSYSRIGWLAFIATIAYLLLVINLKFIRRVQNWLMKKWKNTGWIVVGKIFLPLLLVLLLIVVYAGLILSSGYLMSKLDPRMSELFNLTYLRLNGFEYFSNKLVFAERLVYWQTGFEIFNRHPWLGVGINNAGYYFPEEMVPFGWLLTEISVLFNKASSLPNTKSLWVRLLAETGVIGFSFFIAWLFVLWQSFQKLWKSSLPITRTLGLAGVLGLTALVIEGFSIDSFALPYFWILFGLGTAALQSKKVSPNPS